MNNLPIPVLKPTEDGSHSYVSLVDLIANELGKARDFDDLKISAQLIIQDSDRVPSVAATPNGQKLFLSLQQELSSPEDDELLLWVREWRDDFNPHNAKSSRNQVWVNTFTVGLGKNASTGSTTYFMGLGGKGDDH